jgi:hypothetical protein
MLSCQSYSKLTIAFQISLIRDSKKLLTKEHCQAAKSFIKCSSTDTENSIIKKQPFESKDFNQLILSKLIDANRQKIEKVNESKGINQSIISKLINANKHEEGRTDTSINDCNKEKSLSNETYESSFEQNPNQLINAKIINENESNVTEVTFGIHTSYCYECLRLYRTFWSLPPKLISIRSISGGCKSSSSRSIQMVLIRRGQILFSEPVEISVLQNIASR